MSWSQNCMLCFRTVNLTTFLMLLLLSSFTHYYFMAEGRAVSKFLVPAQKGGVEMMKMKMKMKMMRYEEIGSRPPRCERKCNSCRECEAVQVPVTAQPHRKTHFSSLTIAFSDRQDDISNYKPMSWKCKCGNLFFNP